MIRNERLRRSFRIGQQVGGFEIGQQVGGFEIGQQVGGFYSARTDRHIQYRISI